MCFRVVTYNVCPPDSVTEQWEHEFLEQIECLHPDVLCLQEIHNTKSSVIETGLNSYFGYSQEIISNNRYLKWQLYSYYPMSYPTIYQPSIPIDTVGFSDELKYTVERQTIRQPYCTADIHLPNGDILTIFSCHLQSNGYSTIRRSMKAHENWFDGLELYIDAIKSANKLRVWEAQNLRQILDSIGNERPVIVAGDMNDFNRSDCLSTIQSSTLHDAWWDKGCGFGFTYSGFGLHLRLDHILYNERLSLQHVQVVTSGLSDHKPLVADFIIRE